MTSIVWMICRVLIAIGPCSITCRPDLQVGRVRIRQLSNRSPTARGSTAAASSAAESAKPTAAASESTPAEPSAAGEAAESPAESATERARAAVPSAPWPLPPVAATTTAAAAAERSDDHDEEEEQDGKDREHQRPAARCRLPRDVLQVHAAILRDATDDCRDAVEQPAAVVTGLELRRHRVADD